MPINDQWKAIEEERQAQSLELHNARVLLKQWADVVESRPFWMSEERKLYSETVWFLRGDDK